MRSTRSPTVSVTPSSGSTFPIGTTGVVIAASDNAGNTATAEFLGDGAGHHAADHRRPFRTSPPRLPVLTGRS